MARLFATVSALVALLLSVAAAPASADNYGPPVPTDTQVTIDIDGNNVSIQVAVRANAEDESPQGTVSVTVENAGSATTGGGQSVLQRPLAGTAMAQVYAESKEYDGSPVSIQVGNLPDGAYTVTAAFTPDAGSNFLPSSETRDFTVGGDAPSQGEDNQSTSGVLPDTGGPATWWLLLGLVLLAGGAAATYLARRRTA